MTLQLEHLTDLNEADRDDLLTIYTHGPHCELRIPGMPEVAEDPTRLLRHVQDRDGASFYVGRFNSRLIVAAVAVIKDGKAQVDSICVRQSSAGRDVEARFLRRLLDELAESENEISVHLPDNSEILQQPLELTGFELERDIARGLAFWRLHAPEDEDAEEDGMDKGSG